MPLKEHLKRKNKIPIILIVDDVPRNLQVLSNILNIEGYQISFASSGKQAISVIESVTPDLILLDIMMPDMDGFQVCKLLKSNEKTSHIPIVFITGKAESEDIVNGFKLGAVDYITKPFNAFELLSRVKTHLEVKFSRDALVEYASELELTKHELDSLNKSKDKFFSIIAHDLKGPFSGFMGLSELMMTNHDKMESAEIVRISESMNKAAKRLYNLLENLLEWSRAQMGRMEFLPESVSLKDSVDRNQYLLSVNASDKKININNNVPDSISVTADNNMLNTVLRNLISNAIKFTPENGIINISAHTDDGIAIIRVADNGVGMSEDTLQKLFRIDAKFSTQGTAKEIGTGLGLILCKELVMKMGGQIIVESTPNAGSTFTFTLPLTVN